jgi:UDPglucose 6-dehydrogenase
MKQRMASPVIFDGRNLYEPEQMNEFGFTYYSIGRGVVRPNCVLCVQHEQEASP